MTEQQAYAIVGLLSKAYRRDEWEPDRMRLWARLIADLDAGATEAAVLGWISTEPWPPTVAEIRARATGAVDAVASAEQAWEEVLSNVRRVGSWSEPVWSSDVVARAAMALRGGWQELCGGLAEDELVAERAHFLRLYEGFAGARRHEIQALLPAHPGRFLEAPASGRGIEP